MLINKRYLYVFVVASLLFLIRPAMAENPASNDTPWETFSFHLGYFISDVTTDLRIGSSLGVSIEVENALGLDSSNSIFRMGALWRFTNNRRHRLDLQWYSFRRDGSNTIGQDITIEDDDDNKITIPAGTYVKSFFDLDIYQAAYSYSFFQDDRMDLAASIGLYVMPIHFGLNSSGLVTFDQTERFTAPLPTFGLRGGFAITPKWLIKTSAQAMYLEIDKFKGHVLETHAYIEYLPWKHLGFGLGFDALDVHIEADGEDWPGIDFKGNIRFQYLGLMLYTKLYF